MSRTGGDLYIKVFPFAIRPLNLFMFKLAKLKYIATTAKLKQDRGLWLQPWIVTSNGETNFNFRDPKVLNDIKLEMEGLWQRFFSVLDRSKENSCLASWEWIDGHQSALRSYASTINSRLQEYNEQNAEAGRLLAVAAVSSAVAKIAADAALLLAGLGVGAATLEAKGLLTLFGTVRTLKTVSTTGGFLALFGVGMAKSYGCSLAENWSDAKSADLWVVIRSDQGKNLVQNAPSFVNDVYDKVMKRVSDTSSKISEELKKTIPKPVVNPRLKPNQKPPPNWLKLKSPFDKNGNYKPPKKVPRPRPSSRPPKAKPSAQSGGGTTVKLMGKSAVKGAVFIMAIWSAGESLVEFKKHAIDLKM